MSIIATCGHKVEDIEETHNISTKEWEIDHEGWHKAIAHKSVCETCYQEYKKNNAILETEAEETDWLTSEKDW